METIDVLMLVVGFVGVGALVVKALAVVDDAQRELLEFERNATPVEPRTRKTDPTQEAPGGNRQFLYEVLEPGADDGVSPSRGNASR